jgi:hypothetical protein
LLQAHELTAPSLQQNETLDALRAVVANFFTETAVLKYGLYDPSAGLNKVFGKSGRLADAS